TLCHVVQQSARHSDHRFGCAGRKTGNGQERKNSGDCPTSGRDCYSGPSEVCRASELVLSCARVSGRGIVSGRTNLRSRASLSRRLATQSTEPALSVWTPPGLTIFRKNL